MSRVIGVEHIEEARRRGLRSVEVLEHDIVTAMARETASRLDVDLLTGPVNRPSIVRVDGSTNMRRCLWRRNPGYVSRSRSASSSVTKKFGRIGLVGCGGVGSTLGILLSSGDLCREIVLVDLVPGLSESTALDLLHSSGTSGSSVSVTGSTDLSSLAGCDLIIVSAGRPRTPGMSRSDLVETNGRVIDRIGESISLHAPDSVVIVITNPLDDMVGRMLTSTGFARERVFGMAGTLDSSRFSYALSCASGIPVSEIESLVLGSHGDSMVPVPSHSTIRGRPLDAFLDSEQIASCIAAAVRGGISVVDLRKTGSATIAPAHATLELLDFMRGVRVGYVPVSVLLRGEYGIDGCVLGVPCWLGMGGIEGIEEVRLTDSEYEMLLSASGLSNDG